MNNITDEFLENLLDKNGFDFEAFKFENEYSAKGILTAMRQLAAMPQNKVSDVGAGVFVKTDYDMEKLVLTRKSGDTFTAKRNTRNEGLFDFFHDNDESIPKEYKPIDIHDKYEGYCPKCKAVIKTNIQGNEIGTHDCKPIDIGENEFLNLSKLDDATKEEFIKEVAGSCAKELLKTFLGFALSNYIEIMIVNDVDKKEYILTFQTKDRFLKRFKEFSEPIDKVSDAVDFGRWIINNEWEIYSSNKWFNVYSGIIYYTEELYEQWKQLKN